jgi:hypothetical protein
VEKPLRPDLMQVLSEYYVNVTRKLDPGLSPEEAWDDIEALSVWSRCRSGWKTRLPSKTPERAMRRSKGGTHDPSLLDSRTKPDRGNRFHVWDREFNRPVPTGPGTAGQEKRQAAGTKTARPPRGVAPETSSGQE